MRRHAIRTLLIGCATAAAVALGTSQALAAAAITITGANTGIGWIGTITVSDPGIGSVTCSASSIDGSLSNVTAAPLPYTTTQTGGTPHSLTDVGFGGCMGSGTAMLSVPSGDQPWDMVFTEVGTTPPQASGFVQSAGDAFFHVSMLTCTFDVAGQADMTWTNGTGGRLTFGDGVHAINLSGGCLGIEPTITGTYTLPSTTINIGPT